jgi:hypothetical protein
MSTESKPKRNTKTKYIKKKQAKIKFIKKNEAKHKLNINLKNVSSKDVSQFIHNKSKNKSHIDYSNTTNNIHICNVNQQINYTNAFIIYPNQLVPIKKLKKVIIPGTFILLYEEPYFINPLLNNNKILFYLTSFKLYYNSLLTKFNNMIKYIPYTESLNNELTKYKNVYTYYQPEIKVISKLYKILYNNDIRMIIIPSPIFMVNYSTITNLVYHKVFHNINSISFDKFNDFICDEYDLPNKLLIDKYTKIDENISENINENISENVRECDKEQQQEIIKEQHKQEHVKEKLKKQDKYNSNILNISETIYTDFNSNLENIITDLLSIHYNYEINQSINYLKIKDNNFKINTFMLPINRKMAKIILHNFLYNVLFSKHNNIHKHNLYESYIFIIEICLNSGLLLPHLIITKTINIFNVKYNITKNKQLLYNVSMFFYDIIIKREYYNFLTEKHSVNIYNKLNDTSIEEDVTFYNLDNTYNTYIDFIDLVNSKLSPKLNIPYDNTMIYYNTIKNFVNNGFISKTNLYICLSYLTILEIPQEVILSFVHKLCTYVSWGCEWVIVNNIYHNLLQKLNKFYVNTPKFHNVNNNILNISKLCYIKPCLLGSLNIHRKILTPKDIDEFNLTLCEFEEDKIDRDKGKLELLLYDYISKNMNSIYRDKYTIYFMNNYTQMKYYDKKHVKDNALKLKYYTAISNPS